MIARLRSALRKPAFAAALVAVLGTGAVHASCPERMVMEYPGYTLHCTLISQIEMHCAFDCVQVDKAPKDFGY